MEEILWRKEMARDRRIDKEREREEDKEKKSRKGNVQYIQKKHKGEILKGKKKGN